MEEKFKAFAEKEGKALDRRLKKSERRTFNIIKSAINRKRYSRAIRILGPGVITGAADDDPSGIATYSQTGAAYGTGLLWTVPVMLPLLFAVQESCARIGAVTGRGLSTIIREHYSKKLLYIALLLIVSANVINIGADLGAMATSTKLIFPHLPFIALAIGFAVIVTLLEIFVEYKSYARTLKWIAVVLFAYPITAFIVGQNWGHLIHATYLPHISLSFNTTYIAVGLLGTTISPYMFFWDTSETVEEEIVKRRMAEKARVPRITKHYLRGLRLDNLAGMVLATATAWFIIVVCSSVLFTHGIRNINTAAQAAAALQPLVKGFPHAGFIAKLLFSVGIVGIGFLAVPVLAGSSSYAVSEAFGIKDGLRRKFRRAVGFYTIISLATLVGVLINFLGINPIKALVFTAVFNGVAAVPLIFIIARIGNNRNIMGEYKNGVISNTFVRLAFIVMAAAALGLFYGFATGRVQI